MISLELILPEENKRLCVRVRETLKVGDLKRFLRRSFGINNSSILLLTGKKNVSDDMSLTEAGMFMGSGVIIENGMPRC